jgi:L-malate glycosyltransferase
MIRSATGSNSKTPNRPKVLHVVWNLMRGGTEGQCARMAIELTKRGRPSQVAVFRHEGRFLGDVEQACGPVYDVGIRHMLSFVTLARIQRLKQYIHYGNFELVHCWDADAAIFGSIASRWAGVCYVTSRRDLGQIYPPHKLWLMRRADAGAGAVVVNAEAIRNAVLAAGVPAAKIHVVPNLFDMAEFRYLADQPFPLLSNLPRGKLIGLVARLDPEKDIAVFLKAAAIVSAHRPDTGFVIAGRGPEREKLEKLSAELGIASRTVFLGDVIEVPSLLKRLSVGVLVPRANEGLSNSILEYMAAGLPVVATDCGGNRELVADGATGFIIPCGDAAAAAAAIERLLSDSEQAARMGARGRAVVAERHSPDAVVEKMIALYRTARS